MVGLIHQVCALPCARVGLANSIPSSPVPERTVHAPEALPVQFRFGLARWLVAFRRQVGPDEVYRYDGSAAAPMPPCAAAAAAPGC
jgi:hypothetical protein